jgi:hypothetical protein
MNEYITKYPQIKEILDKFSFFIDFYAKKYPFTAPGQLQYHQETIRIRRKFDSIQEALDNSDFLHSLYQTLQAWGIGARGSNLRSFDIFSISLNKISSDLNDLDGLTLGQLDDEIGTVSQKIWDVIEKLNIVDNMATLVPITKTLHHILPDLIVPMDRQYTQVFFGWHNPQFQYRQRECFIEAFKAFEYIANKADPEQFVGSGWNTSLTKVIDNAIVGKVKYSKNEINEEKMESVINTRKRISYQKALSQGTLSKKAINDIVEFMMSRGLTVDKSSELVLKQKKSTKYRPKIELYMCTGSKSWEGFIAGFPGNKEDLMTANVGTPWIRKILYPVLMMYTRIKSEYQRAMPCLYLIGAHFDDVFLRKFNFFNSLIPHVIILTEDLRKWANRKTEDISLSTYAQINEDYFQKSLCKQMNSSDGLRVPLSQENDMRIGLISHEFPTVAGTKRSERLDILGYDINDHSLVAFEIKGPDAGRPELENLFFQGLEHRNWLEENKMAVKFAFEGLNGKKINTRKRVKLILGFSGEKIPDLFQDLRHDALNRDRHLQIESCRILSPAAIGDHIELAGFDV